MKTAAIAAALLVGFVGLLAVTACLAADAADDDLRINITVKDGSIAEVLRMIAKAGDVNINWGESVAGKIGNFYLRDVTVHEALVTICAAADLYLGNTPGGYIIKTSRPDTVIPVTSGPGVGVESVKPVVPPMPAGGTVRPSPVVYPPPPSPGTRNPEPPSGSVNGVTTTSLEVHYIDAGVVAEMFGGSRVQDSRGFDGTTMWRPNPYNRSRMNGGLDRGMTGFSEMGVPGSPRGGFNYQFGGFSGGGAAGGGFGGGLSGGLSGGLGGGFGGGASGGLGGAGGAGGGGFGQLLPDGMLPPIAYMPLNVLLVRGTQEAIDQFKEVLALLDQPTKQVEISTKFVQIETSLDKAFGIDWFVDNGSLGFFNEGLAPATGLTVVRFTRGRFAAELRTLLNEGRAQVINEPRVTTQNNLPASVEFSTTIPYYSATITYNEFGFRTVDYTVDEVDVTNALYVTPRINKDDSITLDLEPQIQDQVGTVVGPNGESTPIVTSQTVMTRVTVADNETLVIGGLIRKNDSISLHKTPLLSSIPIIGNLFTGKTMSNRNSELVILVTPHIVRELPRD